MPRWLSKLRHPDGPASVRSVYELEGSAKDRIVFVTCPGPSLSDFPKQLFDLGLVIAVNSALELVDRCDVFVFQEGLFSKNYVPIYRSKRVKSIVTTVSRAELVRHLIPAAKPLYSYEARKAKVLSGPRGKRGEWPPPWHNPEKRILPGHCTAAANALSLAVLMRPRRTVLVGMDLNFGPDGQYYSPGVKRNPGPRDKIKALAASRAWMSLAARHGVWSASEVVTTSTILNLRGIKRVSPNESVS
jgi:hypothetical protein